MKSGDFPWCIVETDGNTVTFKCNRCGGEYIFDNTGMSIDLFCEKCEAFCELHKDCKEVRKQALVVWAVLKVLVQVALVFVLIVDINLDIAVVSLVIINPALNVELK